MPAKPQNTIPPKKLELYKKLVENFREIEVKGATMPYTSLNGNMFSFLNSEGKLALRLPKEERENFIKTNSSKLFEAHGTLLKEYVEVPDEVFLNSELMKKYYSISIQYASSLKPKPTKK